jgi:hypothetical protein
MKVQVEESRRGKVEESRRGTKMIEARFLFIFREEQNENSLVIENFVIEYLCGTLH